MGQIDFWYEFASTYSYLTAMRIDAAAADAGVSVRWRPFLLGPIFHKQGWSTSPFVLYPAKGRYMWRDIERLAAAAGLPLVQPDPFPQNGLTASRLALVGAEDGWIVPFSKAVYRAEFAEGRDISDKSVLEGILTELGIDAVDAMDRAASPPIKATLKDAVAEAEDRGIFGAPSFVTSDGELFWGDDRLEAALQWQRAESRSDV